MVTTLQKRRGHTLEGDATFSSIVQIPVDSVELEAEWIIPHQAHGIVLFAHGSGSSRHSRRNQYVASVIREAGIGTCLLDLLTQSEEQQDTTSGEFRFDIELLTNRLIGATRWLSRHPSGKAHRLGYFGASTGAAAALTAAAVVGKGICAVVSRGGRPDLAYDQLPHVLAPTLLIVGENDEAVLQLNKEAYQRLHCIRKMAIVPNATHLFEEPGALEKVANLAAGWFQYHLSQSPCEQELVHNGGRK
jgi:dienelactone hydrolase